MSESNSITSTATCSRDSSTTRRGSDSSSASSLSTELPHSTKTSSSSSSSSSSDKALPVLLRNFPKPTQEIDVDEALHRHPGRWTIQGQITANQQRLAASSSHEDLIKKRRADDLAAVKKELRDAYNSLHSS